MGYTRNKVKSELFSSRGHVTLRHVVQYGQSKLLRDFMPILVISKVNKVWLKIKLQRLRQHFAHYRSMRIFLFFFDDQGQATQT